MPSAPPLALAWPDHRVASLLGTAFPLLQAPMAGAQGSALAIAVSEAGGLGSLPCAMLSPTQLRAEVATIRAATIPTPDRDSREKARIRWLFTLDKARKKLGRAYPNQEATAKLAAA